MQVVSSGFIRDFFFFAVVVVAVAENGYLLLETGEVADFFNQKRRAERR